MLDLVKIIVLFTKSIEESVFKAFLQVGVARHVDAQRCIFRRPGGDMRAAREFGKFQSVDSLPFVCVTLMISICVTVEVLKLKA